MAAALGKGFHVLGRRLTAMERLALCVLRVPPTRRLDMSMRPETVGTIGTQWNHFLLVLNERASDSPLIYVAVHATTDDGNRHVHALLWNYLFAPTVIGAARKSGFGLPRLTGLHDSDTQELVRHVGYVLGQQESVFGSDHHERHQPRERGQRAVVSNQGETVAELRPELFQALKDWKDPSVSDELLMQRVPKSSRRHTEDRSVHEGVMR